MSRQPDSPLLPECILAESLIVPLWKQISKINHHFVLKCSPADFARHIMSGFVWIEMMIEKNEMIENLSQNQYKLQRSWQRQQLLQSIQ